MAEKSLRFARNFSWNLLGQFGAAALNFAILPFVVHRLGAEAYGLYVLMHAVSSYLQACSLGAGAATIKFVASYRASGSHGALRRLLSFSLVAHGLGVLVGSAFVFSSVRFVAFRVFHVPTPMLETADFVLRCAAAGALFASLTTFSLSVLQGLQRFDVNSAFVFLQSSLMPLGAAALIAQGRGLRSIAAWYAALNAGLCLAAALSLRGRVPLDGPAGPDRLSLRSYAKWSLSMWLGPLAWIVSNQFDKVFLARAMSLTAVTLYSVPSGLLQRLQTLPAAAATITVPMMSEIGRHSHEDLRRMYLKSLRFILWTTLPALVLLFAFMPQFLGLWLHGDFGGASVWPSRVLVMSQVFTILALLPGAASISRDKPAYLSAVAWAQALISLIAWRALVPTRALMGVALGTLVGQGLPVLFYLRHVHRMIGLEESRFVGEGVARPALSAALTLLVAFPFHDRATTWPRLVGFVAVGLAAFYGSAWLLLGDEDRGLVRRVLGDPRAVYRRHG